MQMLNKEPGWTEMFLPLQALEVGNICIHQPKASRGPGVPQYAADRPIAALSYKTSTFVLPCLSVLTPFLKVYAWDPTTGRLDLETDEHSLIAIKCNAVQETILDTLFTKSEWLQGTGIKTKEDLKHNFQQMISGNILSIYLHGPNPEKKQMGRVWIWKDNLWHKGATPSVFKKDQEIRIALRFQGVCFLPQQNGKTRLRLQHQTIAIFHKD
jgi:hypothetical protein